MYFKIEISRNDLNFNNIDIRGIFFCPHCEYQILKSPLIEILKKVKKSFLFHHFLGLIVSEKPGIITIVCSMILTWTK